MYGVQSCFAVIAKIVDCACMRGVDTNTRALCCMAACKASVLCMNTVMTQYKVSLSTVCCVHVCTGLTQNGKCM